MSGLLASDARRAAHSAALLASEHDGEVVAAARAFVGILARAGLEPRSVVVAGLMGNSDNSRNLPSPAPVSSRPWRERARMARSSPHLNKWEVGFLNDVIGWSTLSVRQEDTLNAILRKSEGEAR